MSTCQFLTIFGLLVFTFPATYCNIENCDNFGIFNITDPSADTIINPRIQPLINELGNNPIDTVLRNVIIEINRGVQQATELVIKELLAQTFKDSDKLIPSLNNTELSKYFLNRAADFHSASDNVENIIRMWVNLNNCLMFQAEAKVLDIFTVEMKT